MVWIRDSREGSRKQPGITFAECQKNAIREAFQYSVNPHVTRGKEECAV